MHQNTNQMYSVHLLIDFHTINMHSNMNEIEYIHFDFIEQLQPLFYYIDNETNKKVISDTMIKICNPKRSISMKARFYDYRKTFYTERLLLLLNCFNEKLFIPSDKR